MHAIERAEGASKIAKNYFKAQVDAGEVFQSSEMGSDELLDKCFDAIREAKEKAALISGPVKVACIFCPQNKPVTDKEREDYAKKYDDLFYTGFHCKLPDHIEKAHAVSPNFW